MEHMSLSHSVSQVSGNRCADGTSVPQQAEAGVAKTAPPWVDNLFRERMNQQHYLKVGRYAWGGPYEAFGPLFSYWKWILFAPMTAALVLSLTGQEMAGIHRNRAGRRGNHQIHVLRRGGRGRSGRGGPRHGR